MTPTRVFISYAHDSAAHEEAVRDLWVLLRSCGVDAKLDKPAAERRQDWPLWMLRQVREAEYVLVVASPAYRQRAEGDAPPDQGRGVQFEAALIRDELYGDQQRGLERFLPVVLPGQSVDDVPAFLSPNAATHYRVAELTVAGIEPLLRVLTGQPWEVEPPLGKVPVLGRRATGVVAAAGPGLAHELVLDVALQNGQLRCRAVLAGTTLGDRTAPVPFGLDTVWDALDAPPPAAEERLAQAGHRLRETLLDEAATRHLTDLVDRSPLGTVVDVVVEADGAALGLPYELLRLPGHGPLATLPGVRLRRRVRAWTGRRRRRCRGR